MNKLIGAKVSITSRKAQTTRHRITGIQTRENVQFVYVDTPGFQQKHLNALNKTLNKTVTQVLSEVDVVLFVIEPMHLGDADKLVLNLLPKNKPVLLVVNKADLMAASGGIQYRCLYDERCLSHSAKAAPVSACCSPISTEACK